MAFDIDGAKKAGYSETEIADYLGQQSKFDTAGARKAGYSDSEILSHLNSSPKAPQGASGQAPGMASGSLKRASGDLATGRPELDLQVAEPVAAVESPEPSIWGAIKDPEFWGNMGKNLLRGADDAIKGVGGAIATAGGSLMPETPEGFGEGLQTEVGARIEAKRIGVTEFNAERQKAYAQKRMAQASLMPDIIRDYREKKIPMRSHPLLQGFMDSIDLPEKARNAFVDDFLMDWGMYANMDNKARLEIFAQGKERLWAANDALEKTGKDREVMETVREAYRPEMDEWSPAALIYDGLASAPDLLIGVAAGIATGGVGGAAAMGATLAPEFYTEGKNQGLDHRSASAYSLLMSAAEMAPEIGVLEAISGSPAGKKAIRAMVGNLAQKRAGKVLGVAALEGVSEQITEALQMGIESGMLDQSVTLPEALNRLARAGVIGAGMGAAVGGPVVAMQRDEQPAISQPPIPPAATAVPPVAPPAPPVETEPEIQPEVSTDAVPVPATPAVAGEAIESAKADPSAPVTLDRRALADAFTIDDQGTIDAAQATAAVRAQVESALAAGKPVTQGGRKRKPVASVDEVDVPQILAGLSRIKIGEVAPEATKAAQEPTEKAEPTLAEKAKAAAKTGVSIAPHDDGFAVTLDGKPQGVYDNLESAKDAKAALQESIRTGELNKPVEAPATAPVRKEQTPAELQRELMTKADAERAAKQAEIDAKAHEAATSKGRRSIYKKRETSDETQNERDAGVRGVDSRQAAMPESQEQELQGLRREGRNDESAVGGRFRSILRRDRKSADTSSLSRQNGRDEGVRAGERSLGDEGATSAEQAGVRSPVDASRQNIDRSGMGEGAVDQANNDLRENKGREVSRDSAKQGPLSRREKSSNADVSRTGSTAQDMGAEAEQGSAHNSIADTAGMERGKSVEHLETRPTPKKLYRGTESGNDSARVRFSPDGEMGRAIYATENRDLAASYGGGPKAKEGAGRTVHDLQINNLPKEQYGYIEGGSKIGENAKLVNSSGKVLLEYEPTKNSGAADRARIQEIAKENGIKVIVGTSGSVAGNQIAIVDESALVQPKKSILKAENEKKPVATAPDARRDSVLEYLAKHDRGISLPEAKQQGLDLRPGDGVVGIRRAFRNNGDSFDQVAEMLHEAGYPVTDEQGNYTANAVLNAIDKELRGTKVYSTRNENWMEAEYAPEPGEMPAGSLPSDADDAAVVAHAAEIDDAAVERLAIQFGDDTDGFMKAVKEIVYGTQPEAVAGDRPQDQPAPRESKTGKGQKAQQVGDLFGDDVATKQAVADEARKRDAKRNKGQESVETGDPTDLFSQARQQVDIEDKPKPAVSKNRLVSDEAAAAARARILAKLGRANAGIDPELLQDGILLSVHHIESGARTFVAYAKAMLADMGEAVRPYLKQWYMATMLDPAYSSLEGLSDATEVIGAKVDTIKAQADTKTEATADVPNTDANLERDRSNAGAENAPVEPPVQVDGFADSAQAPRKRVGSSRRGHADNQGIPDSGPSVTRELGDQPLLGTDRADGPAEFADRGPNGERGDDPGVFGISPETLSAEYVAAAADDVSTESAKRAAQRNADLLAVKPGLENVKATLPYLLEGQQEDVHKAETRFAKPDGYGFLLTNGTGTGKTFSGLGTIKRFVRQGKKDILIIVPDDKISSDWQASGRPLNLRINPLTDTKDAGHGIVITTYANLGQNDELAKRKWDLVVPDEAHQLMQAADGKDTLALDALRAISMHPRGASTRYQMLNREDINEQKRLGQLILANEKLIGQMSDNDPSVAKLERESEAAQVAYDKLTTKLNEARDKVKAEVESAQGAGRTRLLGLSATPFAYDKTIDWAEGYLFNYGEASEEGRSYNRGDARDQFFMQHFGYRMLYNKLTQPDAKVDSGLLQRQFNSWLKKEGSLSGRMLDVKADYDRRFILVDSAIGNQIDRAIDYIDDMRKEVAEGHDKAKTLPSESANGWSVLKDELDEQLYGKLGHLTRRYLLEAIKAKEVIPHIKDHLKLGRKIVVFHDFKKGGARNPFDFQPKEMPSKAQMPGVGQEEYDQMEAKVAAYNDVAAVFRAEFPMLIGQGALSELISPIDRFKKEFPDVLLINGDERKSDLLNRYKRFQDDATGPVVALVQSDKNKGWSGHDTTGKHQRVLFNLGLPTQPTKTIQQEGRIYRTGQVSNAIFRYLNTGTNWERWAFAQTIAERASAAENLGMGESARALKDAYIAGFEESSNFPAGHEGEGTGGKERDAAANNALTAYDRAKAFYWGTQKKDSRTKAQEGTDYFATPEPLGMKMVEWADARPGEDFLEPSAGHGAIARWAPENANKTAIEPSNALGSRLAMVFEGKIIKGDFESHNIINKYDTIAMNPPFGTGGRTAVDHLAKAAGHLRDGGRIVAIIPTGPAADAKFDKWFYEEDSKPLKPVLDHKVVGPVYVGDSVTTAASFAPSGVVTGIGHAGPGGLMIRKPGAAYSTLVSADSIKTLEKGPRVEKFKPAEGLYLVADIKLPGVTFERAGTKVMTRVVVIEKSKDAPQQISRDLTDIDDINKLFDRLENMEIRPRAKPVVEEPMSPAEQRQAAVAAREEEAQKQKQAGAAVAAETGQTVIEHTTGKGKVIRGVVRTDLTMAQAKQVDEYTFRKNGGFFIREKHLPVLQQKFPHDPTDIQTNLAEEGRKRLVNQAEFHHEYPLDRLVSHVNDIAARWKGARLKVFVHETLDTLPKEVKVEMLRRGTYNERLLGLVHKGDIHLIRQNNGSLEEFENVLFHEVEGHLSLRQLLGSEMDKFLRGVALALPARVRQKGTEYGFYDNAGKPTKAAKFDADLALRRSADEVLAEIAETLNSNSPKQWRNLWERFVQWFNQTLRKRGWSVDYTETEIRGWVLKAQSELTKPENKPKAEPTVGDLDTATAVNANAVPATAAPWAGPGDDRIDNFLYEWQDKHVDTKRVVKAIEDISGRQVEDAKDPYLAEELYHQRTAFRVKNFLNDELKPLLEHAKRLGVSVADLEHYLWARHAEERNLTIAQRNAQMPDGGSGMMTADARAYLAGLAPAQRTKLQTLAAEVDRMIGQTRNTLVGYGLESGTTMAMRQSAWPSYVPLHRADYENDSAFGIGQGFSVKGPDSKAALGSSQRVVNILAEIAKQREQAIVRGEKNRVSMALFGLAKANPNPDWWSTTRLPRKRWLDKKTNTVRSMVDPMWKNKPNVVVVRFPNRRGRIVERAVIFNEKNPRAMRMAESLKNLDALQLEGAMGVASSVSRYISSVNTQYNPVFGLFNMWRDLQEGALNLSTTPIKGQQYKVMKYAGQAIRGIYQDARANRRGQHPTSSFARWFEEMEAEGGTTGYRDLFSTSAERAQSILDEFKQIDENAAKKSIRAIGHWLSDYNLVMENAVRVAAYRTAREAGLSKARAASVSKNLTINFNRKGRKSQQANALYSFFNARVQGVARSMETWAGPAGKAIIAGGLLLGVLQAFALAMAGYDDEDPPEFVKQQNIIIPIGGGKYLQWNMPQSMRILISMGRIPTEAMLREGKGAGDAAMNMIMTLLDAFNPTGTSTVAQTVAPTIVDPAIALLENKQWTGSSIYQEKMDPMDPAPGFTRSKDTASSVGKVTARALNYLTGGTDYVEGILSPTPDQIDYLLAQAFGGVGRELSKAEQTITALATDQDLPSYKIPLLGKLYGTTTGRSSERDRFYDLAREGREHEAELEGRASEAKIDRVAAKQRFDEYKNKHPEAAGAMNAVRAAREVSRIRAEKRRRAAQGATQAELNTYDDNVAKIITKTLQRDKELRQEAR